MEMEIWVGAKEASKKRVSAARKQAAALRADASARAAYVRRTEERLSVAQRASDGWAADVTRQASMACAEEDRVGGTLATALEDCAVAAARLRHAEAAWDEEEEEAAVRDAECERELWGFGDSSSGEGGVGASDAGEGAFAARAAAHEAVVEAARGTVQELQTAVAAARAEASQRHASVGLFQGVGAGQARGHAHQHHPRHQHTGDDAKQSEHEDKGDGHAAGGNMFSEGGGGGSPPPVSGTWSMGTCDRCLQPIDPQHHADMLEALITAAKHTAGVHGAAEAALHAGERDAATAGGLPSRVVHAL